MVRDEGTKQMKPWHIEQLKLEEIWKITKGAGIHVAILDSGAAAAPGIDDESRIHHYDCQGTAIQPSDSSQDEHGTHVAGVLASSAVGVAPEVECSCFDVYDAQGYPQSGFVVLAMKAAIEMNVDLICCTFTLPDLDQPLIEQLSRARGAKIPVFVAAGNERGVGSPFPEEADVIAIAASNFKYAIFRGRAGSWVTLAAPGIEIPVQSLNGDIQKFWGTSAAAPVAAGVAALALAFARTTGCEAWVRDQFAQLLHKTGKASGPFRVINAHSIFQEINKGPD